LQLLNPLFQRNPQHRIGCPDLFHALAPELQDLPVDERDQDIRLLQQGHAQEANRFQGSSRLFERLPPGRSPATDALCQLLLMLETHHLEGIAMDLQFLQEVDVRQLSGQRLA